MIKTLKPYWKDAIRAFGRMSGWIIAPIIISLLAGKWLDSHFDTAPVWLLILTGLSFIASMYGITKEAKAYLAQTQSNTNSEK